jgi:hypothetical protein
MVPQSGSQNRGPKSGSQIGVPKSGSSQNVGSQIGIWTLVPPNTPQIGVSKSRSPQSEFGLWFPQIPPKSGSPNRGPHIEVPQSGPQNRGLPKMWIPKSEFDSPNTPKSGSPNRGPQIGVPFGVPKSGNQGPKSGSQFFKTSSGCSNISLYHFFDYTKLFE